MYPWNIKNNKIGQNDVEDLSINKKAKNVNSNENNSKLENINNFNNGTDWIKFLEILNNLEIEQFQKFNILSSCEICAKQIYDKIIKITNMQNQIVKSRDDNLKNSFFIPTGNHQWNELENLKNAIKQGVNVQTCNEHTQIKKDLNILYIKIQTFNEIKDKLLNI